MKIHQEERITVSEALREGQSTAQCTDLQSLNVTAQTFGRGVGTGRGEPRLSLIPPAFRAFDHLLMLLKPRLNLSRNTNEM